MRSWPKSLVARSSRGGGPHSHTVAHASGALASGHRTRNDVVARLPRGQWWLADGKVLPVSSFGPSGGRRATRAEAGLTEGGGQL
jgi:hypothetical protein